MTTDFILCSVIHYDDGKEHVHQPLNIKTGFVVCGRRHHNIFYSVYVINGNNKLDDYATQGFLTRNNLFLNRQEAYILAKENGQLIHSHKEGELFSEDIY